MRVRCSMAPVELPGDHGLISSVELECSRCEHTTASFGTSEKSIKRCLVMMREECPENEQNFYVCEDDDD
jgi:hypothetical protein